MSNIREDFDQQDFKGIFENIRADSIQNIAPLKEGKNNRVWKVDFTDSSYVLKKYFSHPNDPRDRLFSDYQFTSYAYRKAQDFVSQPIYCNRDLGVAVYSFLSGNFFKYSDISSTHIIAAATFFKKINDEYRFTLASHLPNASEACFSIEEHLHLIKARISNLYQAIYQVSDKENKEAKSLILDLVSFFDQFEDYLKTLAYNNRIDIAKEIPQNQRCISPSDFGFHNALMGKLSNTYFYDFEYAGWDDPAKMIVDFFTQISVPVPNKYMGLFCQICLSGFENIEDILIRVRILETLYKLKWCCIILNVYLPEHLARRKFSNPNTKENEIKLEQLRYAKDIFKKLNLNISLVGIKLI
jgi:hypothetical protein